MSIPIISPYQDTSQFTRIQILPQHMNSDIINNMEMVLKNKVEKKCNKYGYIDKVYSIKEYEEGEIITENFNSAANYNIEYFCRICLPIENTIIVSKIHSVNSELVILKNGPIITFIPKGNINTNIWEISNNITHIETNKVLNTNEYIKIKIDKVKINQNDIQIKTIGFLEDYASNYEQNKYFGSVIVKEEIEDDDNYII